MSQDVCMALIADTTCGLSLSVGLHPCVDQFMAYSVLSFIRLCGCNFRLQNCCWKLYSKFTFFICKAGI